MTGVEFFDARYGGVYAGRGWLLCGPRMCGKTSISLQFLAQGIRSGQRCLLLSTRPAADSAILAAKFGPDIVRAIEIGELLILEYSHLIPSGDRETAWTVPLEGFLELHDIIRTEGIRRLAFNTALPWVLDSDAEVLPTKVFSFIRGLERLLCTFLLTLPKPASASAIRLKNYVEDVVPVSVTLSMEEDTQQRMWATTKHLGHNERNPPVPFYLAIGRGAVEGSEPSGVPSTPPTSSQAMGPSPRAGRPSRVRFSSAVLGSLRSTLGRSDRPVRFGAATNR